MSTVHRPAAPLHLPPDLAASLWHTLLDDATDPDGEIRQALVSRELGIDSAEERMLIFRTVVGLMRESVGPDEDDESWRATFRAIDAERPERPLFREYV